MNVALLADSAVVNSFAKTGAAKIKTEDGDAEGVDGFGGLENDFVVYGAAEERMWVADDGGERWRSGAVGSPEDGFEAADWAGEEKVTEVVMLSHLNLARMKIANKLEPNEE